MKELVTIFSNQKLQNPFALLQKPLPMRKVNEFIESHFPYSFECLNAAFSSLKVCLIQKNLKVPYLGQGLQKIFLLYKDPFNSVLS